MFGSTHQTFLLGIHHLDGAAHELIEDEREEPSPADDATLRLVGPEMHLDPHGVEQHI